MNKALREAFVAGISWNAGGGYCFRSPQEEARKRYPPKTVERERVVTFKGTKFRYVAGRIEYLGNGITFPCDWRPWWTPAELAEFSALVASLIASPLETVEVEE